MDVMLDDRGFLLHGLIERDAPDAQLPGASVVGRIDWPRRYRMMQLHTAEHLAEIALRTTHDVVGISAAPVPSRGDVLAMSAVVQQSTFDVGAVGDWITMTIREDMPMVVQREHSPSCRWTWHLDGLGHRQCDGLHVNSTGEVGVVSVRAHESDQQSTLSRGLTTIELTIEVDGLDVRPRT